MNQNVDNPLEKDEPKTAETENTPTEANVDDKNSDGNQGNYFKFINIYIVLTDPYFIKEIFYYDSITSILTYI